MGIGTSISTAVSERTAVVIEDYMFDASTAGELKPEESPKDFHDTWDLDGTDFTPEVSPDDEGYWDDFENIVLNGNYEDLGSELVTNGDFSNGTASFNEQLGVNFSVTNGVATIQSTGANSLIHQTISPPSVTTILQIEIDVVSFTGDRFNVQFGGNSIEVTTTGKQFLLTSSSRSNNKMDIAPLTNETVVIRSISAKQVDPNDRWTLGTGWSIEDGKAIGTSTTNNLQQLSILTAGDTYELTFTISDYSAGSVRANVGGVHGTLRSSNGTFTQIIGPATSPHFFFDGVSTFTGKIDNVIVKEYAIKPLDV